MAGFEQVIGHEQIIDYLENAIKQEKTSHAYIFCGEAGSGKKLLANTFAKILQCEQKRGASCGVCQSCMQADSGNHPDIVHLNYEKASIGVDDIRTQINNDIAVKPYSSPYKIYIIEDAEKMTEQAQNALLKTIEEPPAYGILLLLSNNLNKLLPTILSRCVALQLKSIHPKLIKSYLMKNVNVPDYLAELSANFSQGNVGRAIRYASSDDFIKMKEEVLHLLKYIDDMEIYEIMESIKLMAKHKLNITDYIDLMILWYRDVLMFKVTTNPNVLLFTEEISYIAKQATNRDYEGIENIIEAMEKAKIRLNANVNFDTAIELMLFSLKENGNGKNNRC